MVSILDILAQYGRACMASYTSGEYVEEDMDTIVEFCHQHGYEFSNDEAKDLRNKLELCLLNKGHFQGVLSCYKCPYSIKGSIFSYNSLCNFPEQDE